MEGGMRRIIGETHSGLLESLEILLFYKDTSSDSCALTGWVQQRSK